MFVGRIECSKWPVHFSAGAGVRMWRSQVGSGSKEVKTITQAADDDDWDTDPDFVVSLI